MVGQRSRPGNTKGPRQRVEPPRGPAGCARSCGGAPPHADSHASPPEQNANIEGFGIATRRCPAAWNHTQKCHHFCFESDATGGRCAAPHPQTPPAPRPHWGCSGRTSSPPRAGPRAPHPPRRWWTHQCEACGPAALRAGGAATQWALRPAVAKAPTCAGKGQQEGCTCSAMGAATSTQQPVG